MNKEQEMTWEKIYGMWKWEIGKFPELSDQFHSLSIEFSEPRFGQCFYYNWIPKMDEEKAIQADLAVLASGWPDIGDEWTKGTLKTASLLLKGKTEEERAAVWLSAFARSLSQRGVNRTVTASNAWILEWKATSAIASECSCWHASSRVFFPELYIPLSVLEDGKEFSIRALVGLAAVNAALVMMHYTPVEYKMAHR